MVISLNNSSSEQQPAVSVVIPCYTEDRIEGIGAAIDSLRRQRLAPSQVIVAVDNNPRLMELVAGRFDWVTVVLNDSERGASATRNRGADAVCAPVIAFLDDDEIATADWLYELVRPLSNPRVIGTGGAYEPTWGCPKPKWFPDEFAWAVGGSYKGLPSETAPVRNVWSGNMAVRTEEFKQAGGFRSGFGKHGSFSEPEDTEMCIRLSRATGMSWMYVPSAVILHEVPVGRSTYRYFLKRCFSEGAGKAAMSAELESAEAIETEHHYVRSVAWASVRRLSQFRLTALLQGLTMMIGLTSAAFGFVRGRVATRVRARE